MFNFHFHFQQIFAQLDVTLLDSPQGSSLTRATCHFANFICFLFVLVPLYFPINFHFHSQQVSGGVVWSLPLWHPFHALAVICFFRLVIKIIRSDLDKGAWTERSWTSCQKRRSRYINSHNKLLRSSWREKDVLKKKSKSKHAFYNSYLLLAPLLYVLIYRCSSTIYTVFLYFSYSNQIK